MAFDRCPPGHVQVWQRFVDDPFPGPSSESQFAVVMIADISGFTALTAWLDESIHSGHGAWKINNVVNQYFGDIVACIEVRARGGPSL